MAYINNLPAGLKPGGPQQQPDSSYDQGQAALLTDPGYQAALASEQAGNDTARAQAQAAIDQATGVLHKIFLPRLQDQHKLALQGIVNALAAHGILNSGDAGYRKGLEDKQYGNSVQDANRGLLDHIQGITNGELSNSQSLHQGVVQAIQSAWQNFVANPGLYTGIGAPQGPASAPAVDYFRQQHLGVSANASPSAAPVARHRQVAQHLVNPYTTGQKLYG